VPADFVSTLYGGMPLGVMACFLFMSLAAALRVREATSLRRFTVRALLLWILGPATVACLILGVMAFRAFAPPG
jgi:putative copper export protein